MIESSSCESAVGADARKARLECNRRWLAANPDYMKKWYAANKQRSLEAGKMWRLKNIDRSREIARKYRMKKREAGRAAREQKAIDAAKLREESRDERMKMAKARAKKLGAEYHAANKERINKRKAEYRKENAARIAIREKAYRATKGNMISETKRAYRKANPEIFLAKGRAREAKKRGAGIGNLRAITAWEKRWKARKRVRCYWCCCLIAPKKCHVDHIVALAKGGAHELTNLAISCGECNCSKGARDVSDWNAKLIEPSLF